MRIFSHITSLLRNLFGKHHAERELDEEVRTYVELLAEEKIKAGMNAAEALRQARVELGGTEQVKEQVRDVRAGAWLDSFLQDLRYALRVLRNSPGFTAAAVVTLALGVGANTAIFSLVDASLWRSLPFREPSRLVSIYTTDATGELHTPSVAEFLALQKDSRAFDQITANGWTTFFYGSDQSRWQDISGNLVTADWLPTLGIQPLMGRNFFEYEQIAGHDSVAMLSFHCWRERFNGDPHILGKRISLSRHQVTIVAVLPEALGLYYSSDLFAPLVVDSYAALHAASKVRLVAHLGPGATIGSARSEAAVIAQRLKSQNATPDLSGRLTVEDFTEQLQDVGPTLRNTHRGLLTMLGAAGLVLCIACANVCSLLLARAVKRQKELAVRAALGCSRQRMIRQLMTETFLLFLSGGGLGVLVARWSEDLLTKEVADIVSSGTYCNIDARVLAFSLGVSLLSALIFGLIPALHATRVNLNDSLKQAAPSTVGRFHSHRSRSLLVTSQIALGMVLLVGFGLLLRSFQRAESVSLGYDPDNVVTASVALPLSRYETPSARASFMRQVMERVRSMPGVEAAGLTDSLPLDGADSSLLKIENPTPNAEARELDIWFLSVSPEYFSTMKIAMLTGRPFHSGDNEQASRVAIVNQNFAKRFFPGENPIGYHLAFANSPTAWREIVGVVSDVRQRNLDEESRALAYFPLAQILPERFHLAIRVHAATDMPEVARSFNRWLRPLDENLFWTQSNMHQRIHDSESLTLRRPVVALLASFGGLALVLSMVGIFGVTSYSVAERTREIGIRVALGATRSEVAKLVLREALSLALAGLAIGTIAAVVLTRLLPTGSIGWSASGILLYGVSRTDGLTYSCVAVLLATVALLSSYIPARRAMRVDPLVALRHE